MNERNVPTDLATLYKVIKGKLVDDSIMLADFIFASDSDEQNIPPPNDSYITLVFGVQQPDLPVFVGAGRSVPLFNGTLATILWSRISYDQAHHEESNISDKTFGIHDHQRRIIKSLHGFDPTNYNGDFLLEEPMRLAPSGWNVRARRIQGGWSGAAATWSIKYILDLESPGWPVGD